MSYKTILVHVDHSRHAAKRIKIAAEIAIAENAHLIGAAMSGVSRYIYENKEFDLSSTVVASQIETLNQRASHALEEFESLAKQLGVLSHEKRLVNDDAEDGLCLQARYSDLLVVGQTDPDEISPEILSDLPEFVMLNSGRPVLIIPYAGQPAHTGKNVLVAWDGSKEATRAITNAIPLLKNAKSVVLIMFNPSAQSGDHGEQPGADMALYLARHGVKVEVSQQSSSTDIGNALLSKASDLGSDLIVMGGYGHKRFREILLGGVTMTLLRTMTVPVLISH